MLYIWLILYKDLWWTWEAMAAPFCSNSFSERLGCTNTKFIKTYEEAVGSGGNIFSRSRPTQCPPQWTALVRPLICIFIEQIHHLQTTGRQPSRIFKWAFRVQTLVYRVMFASRNFWVGVRCRVWNLIHLKSKNCYFLSIHEIQVFPKNFSTSRLSSFSECGKTRAAASEEVRHPL